MIRPSAALALALTLLLAAAAQAAPRGVRVVVDAPPDSKPAAAALAALLQGLGAVQAAGEVEVALAFGAHRGAPSGQMSAWLSDAKRWADGEARGRKAALAAEVEAGGAGDGDLVVISPEAPDAATLKALAGRRVTLLTDAPTPAGCAGDPRAACHAAPLGADPLGAAAVAVERALAGVAGVWVTTEDATLTVPFATWHLTVVVPGKEAAKSETLGAGAPLAGASAGASAGAPAGAPAGASAGAGASATVWALPAAGVHQLALPAGGGRALVVGVGARVVVDDCALAEDDAARWRFASPGVAWRPELGARLRFAVDGGELLAPSGPGRVEIPAATTGAFTLTPLWVEGEVRRTIGETVACVAAARLRPTVLLSAQHEGDEVVVRATFEGPDGRVIAAAEVLEAGSVEARLAGGGAAALAVAGEAAEARLPLPGPGTHTLAVSAPRSRALDLAGVSIELRVDHAGPGGGGAWWPVLLAGAAVALGFLGFPALVAWLRRRRPLPRGVVSISVGGSPVMDRRLGPQTAFPALLVGVRDIPIADGESLARVEVRAEGLRMMVVATVMGRPDATGRGALREERCVLAEARPFEFSNVRVEFIEEG